MKKITSTIKLLVLFTFISIFYSCTDEYADIDNDIRGEIDFPVEIVVFPDTIQVINDARVGGKDGD